MFVLLDADPLLSFGGIDAKSGVLTDVLSAFTRFIDTGTQKVVDAEAELCGALIALQYVWFAMSVGLTRSGVIAGVISFLEAAAWYGVAKNAVAAVAAWSSWTGSLGSLLSGGNIDGNIMRNPSLFMALGNGTLAAMIEKARTYNILVEPIPLLLFFLVGMVLWVCYLLMGCGVVYASIVASIDMVVGVALVPFVIEPRLKFLSSKGFGLIVDAGMSLARASVCAAVAYGFIKEIHLPSEPGIRDGLNLLVAAIVCAFVVVKAARMESTASLAVGAVASALSGKK